mmetsp:Transcript_18343/g.34112  ORF Transcript_18343/g.34112 Transcript_18343/m.34112 type:complete len:90 (+) Transcript_18343:192-461(+)
MVRTQDQIKYKVMLLYFCLVIASNILSCFVQLYARSFQNQLSCYDEYAGYFQYAGGFEPRKAFDITAKVPGNEPHDPMFIVEAVKSKTA